MQTFHRKQLTIISEAPLVRRLTNLLDECGVTGYTLFPALAGKGTQGQWDRDAWTGNAGRMVMIVSIMDDERAEKVNASIFKVIERQIGIITWSDVEVLRGTRFD